MVSRHFAFQVILRSMLCDRDSMATYMKVDNDSRDGDGSDWKVDVLWDVSTYFVVSDRDSLLTKHHLQLT